MLSLDELVYFLNHFFAVQRFGDDQGGVYRGSSRLINRIGLALEPWRELDDWVRNQGLDVVFLHRPWKLELEKLEPDVGVVSYHLAFDECLTLGFNLRLASALGMVGVEVLGEKDGRPIGMIGKVEPRSFPSYCRYINEVFGGQDQALAGDSETVSRVAVVGAMTDKLVREAALYKADVYVTGQLRQPANGAVQETGIAVVGVGHRRCEEWGLQALAGVLRERWFGLEVILPPG